MEDSFGDVDKLLRHRIFIYRIFIYIEYVYTEGAKKYINII
jgi:hypothetical protein